MTYPRKRKPAFEQTPHAVPANAPILAAPTQRAMPEAAHPKPKREVERQATGDLHGW